MVSRHCRVIQFLLLGELDENVFDSASVHTKEMKSSGSEQYTQAVADKTWALWKLFPSQEKEKSS